MTLVRPYMPILKTSMAELRGLRELADNVKERLTPVFELTKSRKTRKLTEGDINKQVEVLLNAYSRHPMVLDLTGHPNYVNSQIKRLQASVGGYRAWVDFVTRKKSEIRKLIPALQVTDEDVDTEEEYHDRLQQQAVALGRVFELVAFRIPIGYEEYASDLSSIAKGIPLERLIAIVDAGFIPQNKSKVYGIPATKIVRNLIGKGVGKIVVAGSSFPLDPIQYGEDGEGQYNLEEVNFYQYVVGQNRHPIIYSDYATIHPEPNLQAGGRGWVPRIDLPCTNSICYRRSRRDKSEKTYEKAYARVGRVVIRLPEFSKVRTLTRECWGIKQIEMASDGYPPGLSPSYWISVRINTHISLRVATS